MKPDANVKVQIAILPNWRTIEIGEQMVILHLADCE